MSRIATHPVPPEFQIQIDQLSRRIDKLTNLVRSEKEVPKKAWYRPSEVCQLLGISRSKFEACKRSGIFPIHRLGSVVYVAASDLEAYFGKN